MQHARDGVGEQEVGKQLVVVEGVGATLLELVAAEGRAGGWALDAPRARSRVWRGEG